MFILFTNDDIYLDGFGFKCNMKDINFCCNGNTKVCQRYLNSTKFMI